MARRLCEICGLSERIPGKDASIAIKPNLLGPIPAEEGATTHPEVVEGIILYLQEHGFHNIQIMEGSWVGDKTSDSILVCGYDSLCEKYHVPFIDLQKDTHSLVDCTGLALEICDAPRKTDFLINVPVLKGHCQTRMTCALKNMKGCLPNSEKRHFHRMGLHDPIGHLSVGLHQDFILVDSICGDMTFEDGGNPVQQDRLFAGFDPVLIDTFGCRLMGIDPRTVPYIGIAAAAGVGSMDLAHATITTWKYSEPDPVTVTAWRYGEPDSVESSIHGQMEAADGSIHGQPEPVDGSDSSITAIHSGESGISDRKKAGMAGILAVKERVHDVDSCSACYGTLVPVLKRLEEEGLLVRIPGQIAIGQGYKGKSGAPGAIGIGSCTARFECSLPGCPPKGEDMYRFLKSLTGVRHH